MNVLGKTRGQLEPLKKRHKIFRSHRPSPGWNQQFHSRLTMWFETCIKVVDLITAVLEWVEKWLCSAARALCQNGLIRS